MYKIAILQHAIKGTCLECISLSIYLFDFKKLKSLQTDDNLQFSQFSFSDKQLKRKQLTYNVQINVNESK